MGITTYVKKAFSMPSGMLLRKAVARVLPGWNALKRKSRDLKRTTYITDPPFTHTDFDLTLPRIDLSPSQLEPHAAWIRNVTGHYLAHRFDLLGSGWTTVAHGVRCRGFEGSLYETRLPAQDEAQSDRSASRINRSNRSESESIMSAIDPDYTLIDWQLDFKSGWRWSESTWYKNIWYGHKRGVDVKVPWELARMQHLLHLAYAYILAKSGAPSLPSADIYAAEFRNQVLDFISANPPRFGVNWTCAMDVAIRVSNWIVTRALFESAGEAFDNDFKRFFNRSVYEHGVHIVNNLEWNPDLRGNHYLSDIAGLIFVASVLPATEETDSWLALGAHELTAETALQFNEDGSNFEGSTAYHRLSAELAAFSASALLGLPEGRKKALLDSSFTPPGGAPETNPGSIELHSIPGLSATAPLPSWFFARLRFMAEFTIDITKQCGDIPQFGDNDSGRFFKFTPVFRTMTAAGAVAAYGSLASYDELAGDEDYLDENHLDHRGVVSAINGFFMDGSLCEFSGPDFLDGTIVRCIARLAESEFIKTDATAKTGSEISSHGFSPQKFMCLFENTPDRLRNMIEIDLPRSPGGEDISVRKYPGFGIYIYRNESIYLAVRCGAIGQGGFGGHSHNDQLGLELQINKEDVIIDPGTYIYTPAPDIRNAYRSVCAHFAPRPAGRAEPGRMDLGLFMLGDEARAECLFCDDTDFVGRHHGFGFPACRMIRFSKEKICIYDWFASEDSSLKMEKFSVRDHAEYISRLGYSPAYGLKYR